VRAARATAVWWLTTTTPAWLGAQGYQLRLDTQVQAVGYRGVTLDSVAASDTVTGPSGGPVSRDGFAVSCNPGGYCTFYRPGPMVHAAPVTTTADATVWGLGMPGLSIRAIGRAVGDLASADNWPGTGSHAQVLEAYAQYASEHLTGQLGRLSATTRFGLTGFDGGRVTLRDPRRGIELTGYGGWGLWNGTVLPVTSPELNPLGDFRPPERTIVVGAGGGWSLSRLDVRLSYQREVDPSVQYFVSERAGVDVVVRPYRGVSLTGGADYDLAEGWWGSAEATLVYAISDGRVTAAAGVRRYRPHFDLWTIWGAFSPVPYTAWQGSLAVKPVARLELAARGEHYRYAPTQVASPLVTVETEGWRFSWDASYTVTPAWVVEGGYHAAFGPGAASRGFAGGLTYTSGARIAVTAHAESLDRPLEFRYDAASVNVIGFAAEYRPAARYRVRLDASRYAEDRTRPDAGAFSWDQMRVSAGVTLLFGGADLSGVPPSVRGMPEGDSR
jgi:hypothetical protein